MRFSQVTGAGTLFLLDKSPDNGELEQGLQQHRFCEPASIKDSVTLGWTTFKNYLETGFDDINDWLFQHHALFCLRMDTRKVPGSVMSAHLGIRVDEWCKEHQRARCPSSVKTELREQLQLSLLPHFFPKTKVVPVLWDLQENWVLVGSYTEAVLESFRKMLFETFGVTATVWTPMNWLEDALREGFEDTPGASVHDFLAWLWYCAENREKLQGSDFWVGKRVCLGDDDSRVVLTGDSPSGMAEGATALKANRKVLGLDVCFRKDEQEYAVRLTPSLQLRNVKIPTVVTSGDEQFYDNVYLIEHLREILKGVFVEFAEWRTENWDVVTEDMKKWLDAK